MFTSPSRWPRSPSHGKCSRRFYGSSRNYGRSRHLRQHETPMLMHSRATDRRSASRCQQKWRDQPLDRRSDVNGDDSRPRRRSIFQGENRQKWSCIARIYGSVGEPSHLPRRRRDPDAATPGLRLHAQYERREPCRTRWLEKDNRRPICGPWCDSARLLL
jgi:hypothetical protein